MRKLIGLIAVVAVVALAWAGPAAAQTIQPASLVPPPDRPKGPSTGMVGEKLKYSTDGTDPFDVHEYMFDWGDGSPLKWKSSDSQSHIYQQEGTYYIRAREKCPLEVFITDWSSKKEVVISGNVADAWLLSINSGPLSGISIDGDAPGKTDYDADIPKGQQVTLSAPASVTVHGSDYIFDRWVLDDVPQAEGVTDLTVQMDADRDAVAAYNVVQRTLTVLSDPVVGVQIAGLDGCTTDYCGSVPDNSKLKLIAPTILDDGDACYGFTGWTGMGSNVQRKEKLKVKVTSDMTVTATYGMIELAVLFPSDPDIVLERGSKVAVEFAALNLPKGYPVQVLLVKGGTDVWVLDDGAKKSPWRWKVGDAEKGEDPYPNGDDYTIVVSALDGAVLAESANPFAIATVDWLEIIGPATVQSGGDLRQYTCIAHYDFGPDVDVTQDVKWRTTNKKYAKVKKTGLIATKPVLEETPVTVTATYGKGKSALTSGLDISLAP